jgi:NAD(P)-dependent dehydrogenase (short-subunit alcohol dehydrogenase family)
MSATDSSFTGKTAIVTGGGTGIGRETAMMLACQGANVVVAGRKLDPLRETCDLIKAAGGARAEAVTTDVRDSDQIDTLVARTMAEFSRLDYVVNNAGGTYLKPLSDLSLEDWERIVSLNLTSAFTMTRSALPHLLASGGGAIVNISSSSASEGTIGGSAYSAAKAGLEMFTKVAAAELSPKGIRINCVAPGLVRSAGAERSWERGGLDIAGAEARMPMRRVGEPVDIARIITYLLSDAAGYITGEVIHAHGGPKMDGISE